jgi:hypothetical protein
MRLGVTTSRTNEIMALKLRKLGNFTNLYLEIEPAAPSNRLWKLSRAWIEKHTNLYSALYTRGI